MNKFRTTLGYLLAAPDTGCRVVHNALGAASAPPEVQPSTVGTRLLRRCARRLSAAQVNSGAFAEGHLPSRERKKPDLADHFLDPSSYFARGEPQESTHNYKQLNDSGALGNSLSVAVINGALRLFSRYALRWVGAARRFEL